MARNWSCDPLYILYYCVIKLRRLQHSFANWADGLFQTPSQNDSIEMWWNGSVQGRLKHLEGKKRESLSGSIHNVAETFFSMIKEELQLRVLALGGRAGVVDS